MEKQYKSREEVQDWVNSLVPKITDDDIKSVGRIISEIIPSTNRIQASFMQMVQELSYEKDYDESYEVLGSIDQYEFLPLIFDQYPDSFRLKSKVGALIAIACTSFFSARSLKGLIDEFAHKRNAFSLRNIKEKFISQSYKLLEDLSFLSFMESPIMDEVDLSLAEILNMNSPLSEEDIRRLDELFYIRDSSNSRQRFFILPLFLPKDEDFDENPLDVGHVSRRSYPKEVDAITHTIVNNGSKYLNRIYTILDEYLRYYTDLCQDNFQSEELKEWGILNKCSLVPILLAAKAVRLNHIRILPSNLRDVLECGFLPGLKMNEIDLLIEEYKARFKYQISGRLKNYDPSLGAGGFEEFKRQLCLKDNDIYSLDVLLKNFYKINKKLLNEEYVIDVNDSLISSITLDSYVNDIMNIYVEGQFEPFLLQMDSEGKFYGISDKFDRPAVLHIMEIVSEKLKNDPNFLGKEKRLEVVVTTPLGPIVTYKEKRIVPQGLRKPNGKNSGSRHKERGGKHRDNANRMPLKVSFADIEPHISGLGSVIQQGFRDRFAKMAKDGSLGTRAMYEFSDFYKVRVGTFRAIVRYTKQKDGSLLGEIYELGSRNRIYKKLMESI